MRIFSVSTRTCAIALIAAAAIGLTACGGGDGGLSRGEAEELQAQLDAAVAQAAADAAARAAAEAQSAADTAAREAAEAAQEAAETQAAADRAARETAEAEAAAAKAAQAAAEAAQAAAEAAQRLAEQTAADDVAAAQALVDAANKAAQTAMAAADKAKEDLADAQAAQLRAERAKTEAERQLRLAQQDARTKEQQRLAAEAERERLRLEAERQREQLEQELTEAEQTALNARASQYIAAINGGGTDRSTSVTVSYMRGDTLKINPGGNFETGSGAPAISGFTPRTYTREVGVSGEQTLYHYTNIQAPGTRAFWKLYGLDVDAAQDDTGPGQDPKPTGTARVVRAGSAALDYGDVATYNIAVSGTYHGVSGTYTCTACALSDSNTDGDINAADFSANDWVLLADGERTFVGANTWDFKPGSISSGVLQNQDTEYLYFGIWVEEPHLASGGHAYQYFTGGSMPFTAVGTLSGTAKFRGGAVGKYVTRDQVGDNAKVGTFTATANFTATFGTAPTLEGRLTDFRNGSEALAGWSVYLGATGNVPAVFSGGALTDQPASALIGRVAATGQWDATLLGTNNPGRAQLANEADAATRYPIARFPQADLAGVVGNFYATNNATDAAAATAAIAGAFAATPSN